MGDLPASLASARQRALTGGQRPRPRPAPRTPQQPYRSAFWDAPEVHVPYRAPQQALADRNTLPYLRQETRNERRQQNDLAQFALEHEAARNEVNTPPGTYLGQDALEMTGLPSVARGIGHLRDQEPGQALPELALGGLGVFGMVAGGGARAPRVRWPMEAPPRLPQMEAPPSPTRIFRGLKDEHDPARAAMLGDRWWHTNPNVASTYAPGDGGAHVVPGVIDESTLNLARIQAEPGTNSRHIPVSALPANIRRALPRGATYANTHEVAAAAEAAGYDGVTFSGIRDSGYANAMDGAYPGFETGDDGRVVALFNDSVVNSPFPQLPTEAPRLPNAPLGGGSRTYSHPIASDEGLGINVDMLPSSNAPDEFTVHWGFDAPSSVIGRARTPSQKGRIGLEAIERVVQTVRQDALANPTASYRVGGATDALSRRYLRTAMQQAEQEGFAIQPHADGGFVISRSPIRQSMVGGSDDLAEAARMRSTPDWLVRNPSEEALARIAARGDEMKYVMDTDGNVYAFSAADGHHNQAMRALRDSGVNVRPLGAGAEVTDPDAAGFIWRNKDGSFVHEDANMVESGPYAAFQQRVRPQVRSGPDAGPVQNGRIPHRVSSLGRDIYEPAPGVEMEIAPGGATLFTYRGRAVPGGGSAADAQRVFRGAYRALEQDITTNARSQYRWRPETPRQAEVYREAMRSRTPEGYRFSEEEGGMMRLDRIEASRTAPDGGSARVENSYREGLRSEGFDTETPLFHGTTREFDNFDLNAPQSDGVDLYGRGVYLTSDADFAGRSFASEFSGGQPNIRPVFARLQNPLIITPRSARETRTLIAPDVAAQIVRDAGGSETVAQAIASSQKPIDAYTFWHFSLQDTPTRARSAALQRAGFDGIVADPNAEMGASGSRPHVVVFDPENVRSQHGSSRNGPNAGPPPRPRPPPRRTQ